MRACVRANEREESERGEMSAKKIYLRSLHNALVYPGLQPPLKCPVCLLQGEVSRQLHCNC